MCNLLSNLCVQATLTKFHFLFVFQLAIDYGIKFLETSAKSSTNVEEVRNVGCMGASCVLLWGTWEPPVSFWALGCHMGSARWTSSKQPPCGLCQDRSVKVLGRGEIQVHPKFRAALCLEVGSADSSVLCHLSSPCISLWQTSWTTCSKLLSLESVPFVYTLGVDCAWHCNAFSRYKEVFSELSLNKLSLC
jgi:hypothetical protein